MPQGTVVTINERGFGFIRPEGEKGNKHDVFFHATGMKRRGEFTELEEKDRVSYSMDESGDRPRATDVYKL